MSLKNTLTDAELVGLYTKGDARAFSLLIDRSRDKVLKSIEAITRDRHLSEDIFQDVSIKVFEAFKNHTYQESGKFMPFVLRIAHNHTYDCLRRKKQRSFLKTVDDCELFGNVHNSSPAADHKIVRCETRQILEGLIARLPESQKEVVILRGYTGMSFKKIARLQQCNLNTALGRMRYGLMGLRKMGADSLS